MERKTAAKSVYLDGRTIVLGAGIARLSAARGSLTLPGASSYILYENELQKSDCPASRNFIHSSMGKRSKRRYGGCKSFCPEFEKAKLV